jgi:transcription initiation factor IIF auxiliary subunit
MIPDQTIPIKLSQKNREWYSSLGYDTTDDLGIIYVKAQDLQHGCNVVIKIICDYCGKEIERRNSDYRKNKNKDIILKDCCRDCLYLKVKDVCQKRYGVDNILQSPDIKNQIKNTNIERYGTEYPTQSDEVKDKTKETCLKKYGVENPLQNKEVKEKIKNNNLEKYGVEYFFQSEEGKQKIKNGIIKKYGVEHVIDSDEVKRKIKDTNIKKYGVENVSQSEEIKQKKEKTCLKKCGCTSYMYTQEFKNKVKQTCLNKYGVEYVLQVPEVRDKIQETLYKNGNVPTSSQQMSVFNLIKELGYEPYLNYGEGFLSLDIALFVGGKKIDVEYDGWYWHKNVSKDIARNHVLINKGWNVIRILSGTLLPTQEDIKKAIEKVVENDTKIQLIRLDDWKQNTKQII